MTTYFDILPQELVAHVYEYDSTYRDILKKKILTELRIQSWFYWLRNYVSTSYWILPGDSHIFQFIMRGILTWLSDELMYPDNDFSVLIFDVNSFHIIYIVHNTTRIFSGKVFTNEQYVNNDPLYNSNIDFFEVYRDDSRILFVNVNIKHVNTSL